VPAFNRIILAPVEFIPIRSFRFALRYVLCLALTAFNAGVVEYSAVTLYRATAGHSLQLAGVTLVFAALLGSLLRVWIVTFHPPLPLMPHPAISHPAASKHP